MVPADGKEYQLLVRQAAGTLPPLTEGDAAQLYMTSCVYYQDSDETGDHTVCDTYRLSFVSTNPLDKAFGSPVFSCDGTGKNGHFVIALSGHCAN
jgi:hypothetical protein